MNSRQRRRYLRKVDRLKKPTVSELLTYSKIFCRRYPDPWMEQDWTEEELKCFELREDFETF